MNKLVHGVGVNDSDYAISPLVKGKQVICLFYLTWQSMLKRCYSQRYQATQPTYIGCSVAVEWHSFMAFKSWMENQDWHGKQLDKDLLFVGNKHYSSNTCVFVNHTTNHFITDRSAERGEYPIGVNLNKRNGKFRARCCNPFTKKREHLGDFICQNKAHEAWRKRKHELACQLAELQADARVAEALRTRYATTVHLIDTE